MVVTVMTHGSHSGCTVTVLLVVTVVTVIMTVAWLAGIAAKVTVSLSTTTTVTVTRSRSQPDWVLSLTWRLVVTQAGHGPARARYYTVALTWISRSSWSWQSWRPTSNWKIRTRGQLEGHGRNLFLGSVGYHLYLILSIIRSNCSSLK
jgi:hypothetical protein